MTRFKMSDNMGKRLQFYDQNYTSIAVYFLNSDEKIYLGDKTNQVCRFCGKNSKESSFTKIAHALPELIGNKTLISNYECDSCNEKFSITLEDHLGKYLGLWRTLTLVRGKKGIPSYKSKDKLSRIDVNCEGIKISSQQSQGFLQRNPQEQEITITGQRQPYIPIAIYKCLTKMAISIMPEQELENFRFAIDWINEENHKQSKFQIEDLKCLAAFTPGLNPYKYISTWLIKRKDNNAALPYMFFVLSFNNFFFQIYLPMTPKDKHLLGSKTTFPYFPIPFDQDFKFGKTHYGLLDFSSQDVVENEDISINVSYLREVELPNYIKKQSELDDN